MNIKDLEDYISEARDGDSIECYLSEITELDENSTALEIEQACFDMAGIIAGTLYDEGFDLQTFSKASVLLFIAAQCVSLHFYRPYANKIGKYIRSTFAKQSLEMLEADKRAGEVVLLSEMVLSI